MRVAKDEDVVVGSNRERVASAHDARAPEHVLDAVAPVLMAVRPDLTSACGGIEVGLDGYPAHFYFYVFCIDSRTLTHEWTYHFPTSLCIAIR